MSSNVKTALHADDQGKQYNAATQVSDGVTTKAAGGSVDDNAT